MKNKKGAIELSVSTIVIIVIGVIILVLGLTWVRGMFEDIDRVTKDAFATADAEIGALTSIDQPLTVSPKELDVERGGADTTTVIIANFEETDLIVRAKTTTPDKKLACSFADTKTSVSKQYTLESGQEATLTLIADEKGGSLGYKSCVIEVDGLTGDNVEEFLIKVVKD